MRELANSTADNGPLRQNGVHIICNGDIFCFQIPGGVIFRKRVPVLSPTFFDGDVTTSGDWSVGSGQSVVFIVNKNISF